MATGRIRRTARRGIAVAVLGWLGVAAVSVLLAPSAGAAPARAVTVEIKNVTPPAASVESGGTVTFVNRIPAENRGGINVPLLGSFSATIFTDVSVSFFGQQRTLATDQSAQWTFTAPATTGTLTYTYRIVPQAGLSATVANQVVNTVAGQLPALPAPTPYVVQTVVPLLPTLPGVNLPQLPTVDVLPPGGGGPTPPLPPGPTPPQDPEDPGNPVDQGVRPPTGDQYAYSTGGDTARLSPAAVVAASAFDPSRHAVPGRSSGGADRDGAGGVAGSYDGASVPVFGQLAGLDSAALEQDAATEAAAESTPAQTLPAAALAAVVALAAVTAALVRTHQASRASR
jgi:hypothetical protein